MFENGDVTNLGYPNPVLSHFRSIEIWETSWLRLIDPLEEVAQKTDLDGKAMFLDLARIVQEEWKVIMVQILLATNLRCQNREMQQYLFQDQKI